MHYLTNIWTRTPELSELTFTDVESTIGQLEQELETVACECITIWKTQEDPTKKVEALSNRVGACEMLVSAERNKLSTFEKTNPAMWKKLPELEGKLLLLRMQTDVCKTTLKDPQYKRFVELFQEAMTDLKISKEKSASQSIKDFKTTFTKVEQAVRQGENRHARAILREGVLILQALYENVENLTRAETGDLENTKERFQTLLRREEERGEFEPFSARMGNASLEEHPKLTALFDAKCKNLTLKSGRSFAGWNIFKARNNPHIIQTAQKLEGVVTQLQAVEELLSEQIPKMCQGVLFTSQDENLFYKGKIDALDDAISSLKITLYQGQFPSEMKSGLNYVSRLEVVARHVRFAVQFFSELTTHYMPLICAQKRLMTVLFPEEIQLLGNDTPLAYLHTIQNLYRTYLACQKLPSTSGEEYLSYHFQYFHKEIKESITNVFHKQGKSLCQLDSVEKRYLNDILIGESVKAISSLELKALFGKMILDYLAFSPTGRPSDHPLIRAALIMSLNRENVLKLHEIRHEDPEFCQLLDTFGWTEPFTQVLSQLPAPKGDIFTTIGDYLNTNAEASQQIRDYIFLDAHTPFVKAVVLVLKNARF